MNRAVNRAVRRSLPLPKCVRDLVQWTKRLFVSEATIVRRAYYRKFGFYPQLDTPRRFTEIINWLKIHGHGALYTLCAGKYTARDYVREQGLADILVPMLAYGEKWDDLQYQSLPAPFIIKATHGSGWNHIVRDKSQESEAELKKKFHYYLNRNLYYRVWQWADKDIRPGIIVERLLQDEYGAVPTDYKAHCFNYGGGDIEIIFEVIVGRFQGAIKAGFYDESWEELPVEFTYPAVAGALPKPDNLDEMRGIAKKLAAGFPYVRVDLYAHKQKVYFGELTFFPSSGLQPFRPDEWDFTFGGKLIKTGILQSF